MPVLKLKIDNINYEVQCKDGEEKLLREAENLINQKLSSIENSSSLTQQKKFLILSLILAGELNDLKKYQNNESFKFEEIFKELNNLEQILTKENE